MASSILPNSQFLVIMFTGIFMGHAFTHAGSMSFSTRSMQNLHLIAYNTRFLIMPWVRVKHLASHILGYMARRISTDWQALYGHPIYYLETFVDREKFAGTSYRAANWVYLGQTTGRGIKDKKHKVTLSRKDVLGYPLCCDFRKKLCGVPARRQEATT